MVATNTHQKSRRQAPSYRYAKEQSADALIQQALQCHQNDQLEAAERIYEKVLLSLIHI